MFLKVPLSNITEYYSEDVTNRFKVIVNEFELCYKAKPDFIARAPGRVNIIGEHIDYEGYGVLPAAIEKDCLITVKMV